MAAQKIREIVGDMIDVRRVAARKLPLLAQHHARALGHHEHGDHAQRVRHFEVAREVFENRRPVRIDVVTRKKALVDRSPRLGLQIGGPDVEDVIEVLGDFEAAPSPPRRGRACRW